MKISEMTYKAAAADDQVPSINPSVDPTENYYFTLGEVRNIVGLAPWDSNTVYPAGMLVFYTSSTVKGIFLVTTTTSAGDAPEGSGYSKFLPVSLAWVNNNFTCADNPNDTVDIGSKRTGTITYTDAMVVNQHYLIILNGAFSQALTSQLELTQVGGPGSTEGESFLVERFANTQINIYFIAKRNYSANQFKLNFEYKGQ